MNTPKCNELPELPDDGSPDLYSRDGAYRVGRTRKAKARPNVTVGYTVSVIGMAWGKFEATYDYTFDHLPTLTEVKAHAGDFESISQATCERIEVRTERKGNKRVMIRSVEEVELA